MLATLGQASASIAHELRNPLGVISNAVYYLKTVLTDAEDPIKEYLDLIEQEIKNSGMIIPDLLDFGRTRIPEREEVNSSELVVRTLERLPAPEGVKVHVEIPKALPAMSVDPLQMNQVLTNLIQNAYQAMPEGGAMTIEATTEKDSVVLSVSDNGCGIVQENLAKIFEPLFTTKARGIGLGLAICQQLIDANNGKIEVKSEERVGTTFTIHLPTRQSKEIEL